MEQTAQQNHEEEQKHDFVSKEPTKSALAPIIEKGFQNEVIQEVQKEEEEEKKPKKVSRFKMERQQLA